jgi:hypothetical protein
MIGQIVLVAHIPSKVEGGNKDEKQQQVGAEVSTQEGIELADELHVPFCTVHAGCVEEVQDAFLQLYREMGSELEHARANYDSYCVLM